MPTPAGVGIFFFSELLFSFIKAIENMGISVIFMLIKVAFRDKASRFRDESKRKKLILWKMKPA